MAHRTKTVGSGKDYATLALALAGEASSDYNITNDTVDLVEGFADIALEFQVYASTESSTILVPNFLTDPTHRILVRVMAGERHAGYWDASKYNLTVYGATALQVYESHIVFDGLQLFGGATPGQALYLDAGTGMVFVNCLIDGGSQRPLRALNSAAATFNNCILTSSTTGLTELFGTSSVLTFLNCDLIGGFYQTAGTSVFKNCYASRPTDDGLCYALTAGSMTWTTCASSDSTVRSGVTASVPFSTATFRSVTPGDASYLRAHPSGQLADAGTDVTEDASWFLGEVDIAGAARSLWDIGAWEAKASQYAIPYNDVAIGGWDNNELSGINLCYRINETPLNGNDLDYARSNSALANDTLIVQLTGVTSPEAGTVTIHLRARFL